MAILYVQVNDRPGLGPSKKTDWQHMYMLQAQHQPLVCQHPQAIHWLKKTSHHKYQWKNKNNKQ